MNTTARTLKVLTEIGAERERQDAKWGEQNHPSLVTGVSKEERTMQADMARAVCDASHKSGLGTWEHILAEEFFEALAEDEDSDSLRTELVQCAAVIVAWIECHDRRVAANGVEHNERCCMIGVPASAGPHPDCPGAALVTQPLFVDPEDEEPFTPDVDTQG